MFVHSHCHMHNALTQPVAAASLLQHHSDLLQQYSIRRLMQHAQMLHVNMHHVKSFLPFSCLVYRNEIVLRMSTSIDCVVVWM